jgi:integrase
VWERSLRLHVLDDLGAQKLSAIKRRDIQDLTDRLAAEGLSGSTVRNAVMALKVIYRRALEDDELTINPTTNLRLPEAAGTRDRAADPTEVTELLAPLSDDDQALWATAAYAGLRRGELRALRWNDVDLEANVIRVSRSWDDVEGAIAPKTKKGVRRVPIVTALRLFPLEHKARTGRRDEDFRVRHDRDDALHSIVCAAAGEARLDARERAQDEGSREVEHTAASPRPDLSSRDAAFVCLDDGRCRILASGDRRVCRSFRSLHDCSISPPARRARGAGREAVRLLPQWRA